MASINELKERSSSQCELCASDTNLSPFEIPGDNISDKDLLLCNTCLEQVSNPSSMVESHWHCIKDSMWSPLPGVQVMAWRVMKKFNSSSWAADLLELFYIDEDTLAWAQSDPAFFEEIITTKDCNGAELKAGDNITIIKDLDVKGANFTAKRGTAVRNISLTSNPEHIEGKVNGTRIVLLTCYVKKS